MTLQLRFNPFTGTFDYVDIAVAVSSQTPTYIAQDATFTVATDSQVLTAVPLKVDGTIVVNGSLFTL